MDPKNIWWLRWCLLAIIECDRFEWKHFYKLYIDSKEWKKRSKAIKNERGNKCQLCSSFESLQVHHNTHERIGHEDDADLIVLCRRCHSKFHGVI